MISKIITKNRINWKMIPFITFFILVLQAYTYSNSRLETDNFTTEKYQENKEEEWLKKWTYDNIGKGFFQSELESGDVSRKPKNVLEILMNRNDEFLIDNQFIEIGEIKKVVINYLHGTNPDGKTGPDYAEKNIPFLGKTKVSKGIVTYKHDLASPIEMVNYTLRCIGEAFLAVKKEKALALFGNNYFDLDEEKQSAIDEATPVWFFYELPQPPTPSVWLPYDRKPSKPDPIKITFKGNGNVVVENHKFETFEEFKENLKYWNEELEKFNKTQRIRSYYRAKIAFENISVSEQKDINYLLYKNNVNVEQINSNIGSKSISILLKPDKDGPDLEKIRKNAEKEYEIYNTDLKVVIQYLEGVTKEQVKSVMDVFLTLGINNLEVSEYENKKPSPPLFLMRLSSGEIQNALGDILPIDAVSKYAENWLKNVGTNYTASIYVYKNVSDEQIEQLKQEMIKGGIEKEIIIKIM